VSAMPALAVPALRSDEVPRDRVRLVAIARAGDGDVVRVEPFAALPGLLRAGDLVIVNDAATLPASLSGIRFGAGDHRTRTEHRPPPPPLSAGDRVRVGAIDARVISVDGRRVELAAEVAGDALWQALYASGRPVQYAHRTERLPLWSVQTAYAARPWAVEMPSAGRPLTWDLLLALRRAGVAIASLTHAAGLSSTGDAALDRALPWPERYDIPARTADAIAHARTTGGRVIAIGTTVVRALEASGAAAGEGVAALRLAERYRPRVVDGLVSGLHAPGESHFDLLSAFAPRARLETALALAAAHGLSAHELGDACLIL